jgi:hypothetical protein
MIALYSILERHHQVAPQECHQVVVVEVAAEVAAEVAEVVAEEQGDRRDLAQIHGNALTRSTISNRFRLNRIRISRLPSPEDKPAWVVHLLDIPSSSRFTRSSMDFHLLRATYRSPSTAPLLRSNSMATAPRSMWAATVVASSSRRIRTACR